MSENLPELDPRVEKIIRTYVLSLLILPASLIAVGSFVLGFFVNKVAYTEAYAEAYSKAYSKSDSEASAAIIELTKTTTTASIAAATARKSAETSLSELNTEKAKLEKLISNIKEKSQNVQSVLLENREGTRELVRLRLKSEEIYKDAQKKLGEAQTTLDKLNIAKIISQSNEVVERVASSKDFRKLVIDAISKKLNKVESQYETLLQDSKNLNRRLSTLDSKSNDQKQRSLMYDRDYSGEGINAWLLDDSDLEEIDKNKSGKKVDLDK